jgi:hypothetical protein
VSLYGTLSSGTTNVNITRGLNGWNCIGNPFPSGISIRADATTAENFLTTNAAQFDPSFAVLYLWDEPALRTSGVSYYKVIGNSGFTSARPALDQTYLQPGQGFIVKAKTGGGTISFTNAMQIHENSVSFLKSAKGSWPGFNLVASSALKSTSTAISFNQNMTLGLDVTYDAGLLGGDPSFSLYSRLAEDNGINFMLQCLPDYSLDSVIIPIGFDFTTGGQVSFVADITTLPFGCRCILEDHLLNIFTDLEIQSSSYSVNIDPNTSGIGRFFIHTSGITTNILKNDVPVFRIYSFNNEIFVQGKITERSIAKLYDITGRMIRSYELFPGNETILHADGIQGGVYIFKMSGKDLFETKKLFLD